MSISYDKQSGVFELQTAHSYYQMQVCAHGYLRHLYYGACLHGSTAGHCVRMVDRGFSGNPYDAHGDRTFSLDTLPQEYPAYGSGDYRETCLQAQYADGSRDTDLRYHGHCIIRGKEGPEGLPHVWGDDGACETLEVDLGDEATGLSVTLVYNVFPERDAITRRAVIRNSCRGDVRLYSALSMCADFRGMDYDVITFHGRHAFERAPERTPVRHGKIVSDSVRGASSHQQNPFVILCAAGANEEWGDCWGFSLVYSGDFTAKVEVDQTESTRVVLGLNPTSFTWLLAEGERFTTPETVLVYSGEGLGGLSRRFHTLYRHNLCRGEYRLTRRPVLINNWEATYFDFDDDKLVAIAEDAAQLGIELLVMDDGWFGARDNDTRGLGDWVVNEKKLRGGLESLCKRVNAAGVKLGIWLEPEMVSEDSDLFRAHPEWKLCSPGRLGVRSRSQFVLDMARADVRDYLFGSIGAVLRSAHIEYVKWDMNRHITNAYSASLPPERQGEVTHRYMLGVYELLERLTAAFPHVLFEGCSGGGGRFDAGMLYYTPQIWCSDNTDAAERIRIQYGTSFGYPIASMGAHVSACPNHQTGRTVPLETRGAAAMAGTFGYELDINRMSPQEKETIRLQVAEFKRLSDLLAEGDYHRLSDPFANERYAAWQFVSPDKAHALLEYVQQRAAANAPLNVVKLRGLAPERTYRLTLESTELTLTGAALMHAGLTMPPIRGDYQSVRIELQAIN